MGVYLTARLPSTYQEVEYIQSSGTQYIDTGKTVSGDVKADYTYMPKETVTSSTAGGLLVFIDNDRRNNGFGSSNTYTYYGGNTSNNEGYTVGTLQQNVLCHDIVAKSGCSRTLNGTTVSYVPSSSYPSPTGTLKLFVSQRAGSIVNYWKTRMYSFKRYDSGVLTQDLVPCYRKSDSVIGVYDLVNNQFFSNAGTGTFTKGADVTAVPLKNAYIGEVYEYSYTFKGKTATEIGNEFSTLVGTINVNSNGLTGPSGADLRIKKNIPSLATAKRITISGTDVVNTSTIANNAISLLIGVGSGWGTGAIGMNLQGNTYTGVYVSGKFSGTNVAGTVVGKITANGTYKPTVIIDLENKMATGILSGFSKSTLALTDAQVAEIRTFTYLCPYVSCNHSTISDISITIGY